VRFSGIPAALAAGAVTGAALAAGAVPGVVAVSLPATRSGALGGAGGALELVCVTGPKRLVSQARTSPRIVIEWAHPAGVRDLAVLVDYIETFGPRGVGQIRGVIHIVDSERQRIFLSRYKVISDGYALLQRFRLRVADIFFYVGFHLPFVRGMRFADVNGQEVGAVFVIVINLDHVPDVAPEGRSSIAAEDHN